MTTVIPHYDLTINPIFKHRAETMRLKKLKVDTISDFDIMEKYQLDPKYARDKDTIVMSDPSNQYWIRCRIIKHPWERVKRQSTFVRKDDIFKTTPKFIGKHPSDSERHTLNVTSTTNLAMATASFRDGVPTSIVRVNNKIYVLPYPLNYTKLPTTSVRVHWKLSFQHKNPTLFLIYTLLNRSAPVMALMKTGNNTAICVFETLAGALKAIRNSVAMPGKCRVIVSWWYSQLTNFATFQRVKDDKNTVSRWLMTQVKDILSAPGGASSQSSLVDKKDRSPDRTSGQRFTRFPRLSYQLSRTRSSDLETRDGSEDEIFKDEMVDMKARYSVCPRASREGQRRTISVCSEPSRKSLHVGDLHVA